MDLKTKSWLDMCSLQGRNILGYEIKLHIHQGLSSGTGSGRSAFHCYPVLKLVIGCILYVFKLEEMVVEGGIKKIVVKDS